ncbi:1,2-phenylacetyl-CoA epoxidase subunit PaaC [Numidum massiliense]|uniref:1,2-phenylacetyl-CoA epoxidase subunit PaaC n=1 Tax=Numidum massiliense TaxID=1522315 RepID=UPI0006D559F2|nr:1,2-phenylacetyl-CoA epoxidase subunit PaaC [Numidum massiliense]
MGANLTEATALTDLLFQLADDDFINAYRGSEWLGLAPHIEEDVALSSISQDTMGHAALYYGLLEKLGLGNADDLSHLREEAQFKNAIVLEWKNGPGKYNDQPQYDWALTVVRQLMYNIVKKIRLRALRQSSYEPLVHAAVKIATEHTYHLMHWELWFKQLMTSTRQARQRMEQALARVWPEVGGLLTLGPKGEEMVSAGLIESEAMMKQRFMKEIEAVFSNVNYTPDGEPGFSSGDGRRGEHTDDLTEALQTLSEVYRIRPLAASW